MFISSKIAHETVARGEIVTIAILLKAKREVDDNEDLAFAARSLAKSLVSKPMVACTQEEDHTSTRVSHLACSADLRLPAIRNQARLVPIFAISRTGENPNDLDHRLQAYF